MANDLSDVGHWYGGDLLLSPTGDLALATRTDRSRQRVLRRLMTAPGDYLAHPLYGAGLPLEVGENFEAARIRGNMRSQMALEASVQSTPEPSIKLVQITNGISAEISYTVAPERLPAALSFDVEGE